MTGRNDRVKNLMKSSTTLKTLDGRLTESFISILDFELDYEERKKFAVDRECIDFSYYDLFQRSL